LTALLAFEGVVKGSGASWRGPPLLDRVTFDVQAGDMVGIYGDPRTGKSTLLRLAAGIDFPDEGVVRFHGHDRRLLPETERALILRRSIGYVPSTADSRLWRRSERVIEYVGSPLLSDGISFDEASLAAIRVLERVGAERCQHAATHELSPAELTLVSLARGLVREPELVLIDEPAVSPSPTARDMLRDLLRDLNRAGEHTLVIASGDFGVLRGCRRVFSIGGGQLVSSESQGEVVPFPTADQRARSSGQ
jgi:predicted ABC-type transport system involved in lysophospholipase L1 biosynthesis ATPase subunit